MSQNDLFAVIVRVRPRRSEARYRFRVLTRKKESTAFRSEKRKALICRVRNPQNSRGGAFLAANGIESNRGKFRAARSVRGQAVFTETKVCC